MKVLHISNIAGVSSLLVKGLRHRGLKANLVVRKRHRYVFPHETIVDVRARKFLLYTLKLSRRYDIVHIHGLSYREHFNIDIIALKTLGPKLIVHLHGSEIRTCHSKISTKVALQFSNQVLVSTPDLLFYYPKATWLPNPIDPIFKPLENPQRLGKALYFRKWYEPEKEKIVKEKCMEMGLELTIPTSPIPYKEMPRFLNQFEVFFDRFTIPSLSKTALEALACGCKVVSWKGLVTNPEEIIKNHDLSVVTKKLLKIYKKMLS